MSAAKDDNDDENPELLNQIVQFTRPHYLFTKCYVLLLISVSLPLTIVKCWFCSSKATPIRHLGAFGAIKSILEYGVRAPILYGNLREQTGQTVCPQKKTRGRVLFLKNIRTSAG